MSEDFQTPGVLFVCLGNICRSPTAQGVFEQRLAQSSLAGRVRVDSAGTGAYHLGAPADPRAREAAGQRGYRLDALRARRVTAEDFQRFDWILAMDAGNLADLETMRPAGARARLGLFMDLLEQPPQREVPDPYYGGEAGFEAVLDLCEAASDALLRRLEAKA